MKYRMMAVNGADMTSLESSTVSKYCRRESENIQKADLVFFPPFFSLSLAMPFVSLPQCRPCESPVSRGPLQQPEHVYEQPFKALTTLSQEKQVKKENKEINRYVNRYIHPIYAASVQTVKGTGGGKGGEKDSTQNSIPESTQHPAFRPGVLFRL